MNFLKRTLTSIVVVVVLAGCILCGETSCTILFGLLTLACTAEFRRIVTDGKSSVKYGWDSELCTLFSYLGFWALLRSLVNGEMNLGLLLALFMLAPAILMIRELYRKQESPLLNMATGLMPVIYVSLPMAMIPVLGTICGAMTGTDYNGALPLALFIFIWLNDAGAFCVGCTLGRHRLFPRISPKKSWEGSIGGAVISIAAAVALPLAMPVHFGFLNVWIWILIAVFTVVFGTFGDLVESLIKRELGIKDSGNVLPGHGGFLDRFDSTLLAVPAVTAIMLVIFFQAVL